MTTIQTANDTIKSASTTATAFGISYSVTSILSALLVILKESNQTVFDALVALTGHHWVSQGVLDVVVFVALGFALSRTSYARMTANSLIITIVGATVVSGLIIAGFFI
ncbi:hypothetical protein [Aurantimonas sp. A3-2-R12]|uniref:hypothetical protein n=1 Tax=Aurantimonas sp. A3-2-R12 TaxID=3114362 RepID=UPI002E19A7A2|nr:hypothetical protein [Aurantimonas sp. A3-2-R12]